MTLIGKTFSFLKMILMFYIVWCKPEKAKWIISRVHCVLWSLREDTGLKL